MKKAFKGRPNDENFNNQVNKLVSLQEKGLKMFAPAKDEELLHSDDEYETTKKKSDESRLEEVKQFLFSKEPPKTHFFHPDEIREKLEKKNDI